MSEMDAASKMEQFWENQSNNNSISGVNPNMRSGSGSGGQGHGQGSGGASMGGHGHHHHHHRSGNQTTTGMSLTSTPTGQSNYERNLNFTTGAIEESDYGYPKKKTVRDPLSHRIIEKRRRDRMNNCLADLARLLPPSSLRKGRGRIEKTEIVELAIKHLRHLQCHPCPSGDKCEFNYIVKGARHESIGGQHQLDKCLPLAPSLSTNRSHSQEAGKTSGNLLIPGAQFPSTPEEHFRVGFQQCMSETMTFLVEEEGMYPGDSLCMRILKHLKIHSQNLLRDNFGKDGKLRFAMESQQQKDDAKEEQLITDFNNTVNVNYSSLKCQTATSSSSDGQSGQDMESKEDHQLMMLPVSSSQQQCHGHGSSPLLDNSRDRERVMNINLDYEGENSCSSTQLSLDISDVYSTDSKNTSSRKANKPKIPAAIICRNSTINCSQSVLSSSNGRSSDEGQDGMDCGSNSSNSQHRYKFKNNIKQRFNADLMVPMEDFDKHCSSTKSCSGSNTRFSNIMMTKGSLKDPQHQQDTSSLLCTRENYDEKVAKEYDASSPLEEGDDECSNSRSSSIRRHSKIRRSSSNTISKSKLNSDCGAGGGSDDNNSSRNNSFSETSKMSPVLGTPEEDSGSSTTTLNSNAEFTICDSNMDRDMKLLPEELQKATDGYLLRRQKDTAFIRATSASPSMMPTAGGRGLLSTSVVVGPSSASATLENPMNLGKKGMPNDSNCVVGPNDNVGVPAFALHDKGLYYIPLTIDKSVLSPYLAQINEHSSPPLHPVTISVCFLLAQSENKSLSPTTTPAAELKMDNDHVSSSILPINSPTSSNIQRLSPLPVSATAAAAAVTLPIIANAITSPASATSIKLRKGSNDNSTAGFIINRFSQARQYSPVAYRYPITGLSSASHMNPTMGSGPISLPSPHHQNMISMRRKEMLSHHHQPSYYTRPVAAEYYATSDTQKQLSSSTGNVLLPNHIGGYGSSSSSSSTSSIDHHNRMSRKRSVISSSSSPISRSSGSGSGSSNMEYHSMYDKYSPNPSSTLDYYQVPQTIHFPPNPSHFQTHRHNLTPFRHHHPTSISYGSMNHLVPFRDDKHTGIEMDRRRSCSPSKRSKKSRDVEESLKPKPFPIGLPAIPLPPTEQCD